MASIWGEVGVAGGLWKRTVQMPYLWFFLGVAGGGAVVLLVLLQRVRRLVGRACRAEQLAQKGQTNLSGLIGGLAHELKNPLSTITVNLKLLAEDFQNPQTDRERHALVRLDVVGEETRRLSNLLDEVLKFVRQPELHRRECNVNELMQNMVDFYSPQARSEKLTLRHQLHSEPLMCEVDMDLIKQALLNIFINAQQAMPDGGELMIRTSVDGGRALINITDTGPGISESDRQKVFEVSFSTKQGGSGLGLPTAKRIIEAHQGSIEVQSSPGRGTNFRISLPLIC